jgi:hypothetical protein
MLMRYLLRAARIAFGGWFIIGGLNYWVRFLPQPIGATAIARQFTLALIDSQLFFWVKSIEVLAGLCIVLNLFTPLALAAILPLSVVIFFWDVMLDREAVELTFGPLVLLINVSLILAYHEYYRPMLARRARAWGED